MTITYKSLAGAFAAILLLGGLVTFTAALQSARTLSEQVLRLHILPHSNSEEDQAAKLAVRDRILTDFADMFREYSAKADAMAFVYAHTNDIANAARDELSQGEFAQNGLDHPISIALTRTHFPTTTYTNGIRLPAGHYSAIQITIGDGNGANWWCVLFPAVCFSGSVSNDERLDLVLGEDTARLARYPEPGDVQVRFKIVEWIDGLFGRR